MSRLKQKYLGTSLLQAFLEEYCWHVSVYKYTILIDYTNELVCCDEGQAYNPVSLIEKEVFCVCQYWKKSS